jgi:ubiquinone/menaquinone biosynthesis C-methylase UbiE
MKMNWLERMVMNSPIRSYILRHHESPLLMSLGGRLDNLNVLEVGCGRGVSTQLLLEEYGARTVTAIDLDPDMVQRTRNRLARYLGDRVCVQVADVTRLEFEDARFDAVVDFAALHHVPDWQQAVREIVRVLKPGGRFLFEEVTSRWLNKWFARTFFVHPTENRFTGAEFLAEVERQGIPVGQNYAERGKGDYIFGAGTKAVPAPFPTAQSPTTPPEEVSTHVG